MTVKVTAHSGFSGYEDNKLESILAASQLPIDCLEIDVRLTKDRVAVLEHDDCIAEGGIFISQSRFEDLPSHVLTVEKVLTILSPTSIHINFDIKDIKVIPILHRLIVGYGYKKRHHLTGLDADLACLVKKAYPELIVFINEHGYTKTKEDLLKNLEEGYKLSNCDGFNIHYCALSQEIIDLKNKYHIPLSVWTVDNIKDIKMCATLGVDRLTTNNIEAFLEGAANS
ncbi:glycerophosphodiester phosphodiesterase [Vallitalea pronyensis]|uniref:Glycerophosphodiester phosphodiesterase n=1 Tax=Vallitalea pronyensis TaxID=1348613 RepID=A0A8J8SJC1_9FIRM|nr:glycerophosphodiester phosphodiesterase [Vallitalea pronyensis]QUI25349.1 glycerophosphodiester phosphodiesterase [Vallitalea pronyensis]